MQSVREQLAEALEAIYRVAKTASLPGPVSLSIAEVEAARRALDRARAEPEGCICDTCPVCAVSVRDCQCYREGIEAQREPAGRGTP